MEEQRAAGGAERQVAQLVEDDEIGVSEPGCDLARFALKLFLFEGVDEFDGGEEPNALSVMLDGLDADGRGDVRLARAGAADQDDIVGVLQELAAMQLADERLVDLAAGEVEAGEVAVVRKAGSLELVGGRSAPPRRPSPPSGAAIGWAASPQRPGSLARSARHDSGRRTASHGSAKDRRGE